MVAELLEVSGETAKDLQKNKLNLVILCWQQEEFSIFLNFLFIKFILN